MGVLGAAEKSHLSTPAGVFDTTVNGSISSFYQIYNIPLVNLIESIIIHSQYDLEIRGRLYYPFLLALIKEILS